MPAKMENGEESELSDIGKGECEQFWLTETQMTPGVEEMMLVGRNEYC